MMRGARMHEKKDAAAKVLDEVERRCVQRLGMTATARETLAQIIREVRAEFAAPAPDPCLYDETCILPEGHAGSHRPPGVPAPDAQTDRVDLRERVATVLATHHYWPIANAHHCECRVRFRSNTPASEWREHVAPFLLAVLPDAQTDRADLRERVRAAVEVPLPPNPSLLDEVTDAVLAVLPDAQTDVLRTTAQHEADISAAFLRGYDKGTADAQTDTLRADLRERVATVLGAHLRLSWADRPFSCACAPGTSDGTRSHHEHLADAVLAVLPDAPDTLRAGER